MAKDNLFIKVVRMSDNATMKIGKGHDWQVLYEGLDGFGSLDYTLTFKDNAVRDGGIITDEHLTKAERTMQIVYTAPNSNDVARKKALEFFNLKDTFKVMVTYGMQNVYATGRILKMMCPMGHIEKAALRMTITFMFPDPYWNSQDDFGQNIAAVTGMIGFPYLARKGQGTTGGIFNYAQEVTFFNDGDVATYCKAVISASDTVINPSLLINGEYVKIIDEMENGDTIDLDFTASPPTVKKNGSNFIGHCDRTSNFAGMVLERGSNTVKFDADNGSSNLSVVIYYNKKYEAI